MILAPARTPLVFTGGDEGAGVRRSGRSADGGERFASVDPAEEGSPGLLNLVDMAETNKRARVTADRIGRR